MARGSYHQSNIAHARYDYSGLQDPNGLWGGVGDAPVYSSEQNELLWAEALLETGNLAGAATHINTTRVGRGGLPAATAADDPPDEPPAIRPGSEGLWIAPKWLMTVVSLQAAEEPLAEAARCAPRLPVVHETMGLAYVRQGRPLDALASFRRAAALQPTEATSAWIARLELALGARSPEGETRVILPNR